MKIFVGLVSPDEGLRRHFGKGKDGIIPTDALNRGYFARGCTVAFGAYVPDGRPSREEFERMLLAQTRNANVCLLLIDRAWSDFAANVRNACFSVLYDQREVDGNHRNFFHRTMKRFLRSFSQLAFMFDNADDRKLLSLPLRNFHADELREIACLCADDNQSNNFNNEVQRHLARMRERCRPRKRSDYKTTYAVDDRRRFFSFGPEQHSRFGTGDPHKPFCEFNGLFRFGNRIDSTRHYNVSETEKDRTTVTGEFFDCHGNRATEDGKKTHLNMFSNDFY